MSGFQEKCGKTHRTELSQPVASQKTQWLIFFPTAARLPETAQMPNFFGTGWRVGGGFYCSLCVCLCA